MKKTDYNIQILRIICCIAVVAIHYVANLWNYSELGTFNWTFGAIIDSILRFSVPVFYMISGAMLLSKKDINLKDLYLNKILKILIILIIWLTLYGIFNLYRYGGEITGINSFIDIFKNAIDNQLQFWFLFPLLGMYICLPILKKITENEKIMQYFLILFFLFQIVRPSLIPIIGNGYKLRAINLITPDMIAAYIGYFVLGYYLYTKKLDRKKIKLSYCLGIASIIIATLGTIFISINSNQKFESFFGYHMITTFFASIAIFNFFKYNVKMNIKYTKFIDTLAGCTLGVYILHNFVRWGLPMINIDLSMGPIYITFPLFTLGNVIICMLATIILKKIPIIGKWII